MKVYNDTILNELQGSIDSGNVSWERQQYGFLSAIDSAGIRIELYFDQKLNLFMGQNVIRNEQIDSSYIHIWKGFAPGKYLIKDYRKQIMNKDGECPYVIAHWTSSDENQHLKAILREILEGDKEDTDVTLDGRPYKVIKIVDEDTTPSGWVTFEPMTPDIAHCLTLIEDKEEEPEDDEELLEEDVFETASESEYDEEDAPVNSSPLF